MELDLSGVADFLVLIEEGHYGRAAARLHMTTSALSKRIQRLEHQVGARLLVRGPTGTVGPTASGARFAQDAGPLLAAARAARAAARAVMDPFIVRLGIPGGFDHLPTGLLLTEVRLRLLQRCPGTRLVCHPLPIPAVHSSLLDHHVDVVWGAFGKAPSCLDVAPAGAFQRVAVLPAGHRLADAGHLTASDILDLPLQRNPAIPADWMAPFFLGDIRPARQARLVDVDASTATAAFQQVLRGEAVTTGVSWLTAHLDPRLRAVSVTDLPWVPVYVSRRRHDRRASVLTLFDVVSHVASTATPPPL